MITGASSGIGRALAEEASRRGHALTLVARDPDALEAVGERCRALGASRVDVRPADVGDDDAVRAVVEQATAEGPLDAVVHSAGVVAYGRFEEVPAEVVDGVFRTNIVGSANVARHVLSLFRRQRRGHLVLVGSVLGDVAAPLMTPYAVSKAAVRSLGRQLDLENRDLGDVHVSVVSPGSVDTPIYEVAANYLGHPGRPPFPVIGPERVARAVLAVLDRPRPRVQVGPANFLMRTGFSTLPWLYDVLVGPLFALAAVDHSRELPEGPGSVLRPTEHGLRGSGPGALTTLGRNLARLARGEGSP